MYLYRVCLPPGHEAFEGVVLVPGGNEGFTGFWTPHKECAVNLWEARQEASIHSYGGGTWAKIYRIPAKDAITAPVPADAKTGHSDTFDRDEVFVTKVLSTPVRVDLPE